MIGLVYVHLFQLYITDSGGMEVSLRLLMKEANKTKHAVIRKTCQEVIGVFNSLCVQFELTYIVIKHVGAALFSCANDYNINSVALLIWLPYSSPGYDVKLHPHRVMSRA